MSFSCAVRSRKGTSVRTPISRQTSVISDHIRLFQGATAPPSMVSESSGHERAQVDRAHGARAAAVLAGSLRVEGQLLGGRRVKVRAAVGADELLARRRRRAWAADSARSGSGGWQGGSTSAAGCSEAPCPCRRCCGCRARPAAGAARARRGHTAPRPRRRLRRLRHAAAGVGGQRLEIAARALGVQHAQRERGLARAGHAGDADDFCSGMSTSTFFRLWTRAPPHENFVNHGVNSSGYR